MDRNQRADVIRGFSFFGALALATIGLFVMGSITDDDDDNLVADTITYLLAGYQTEYVDVLPYIGWYKFYKRTKENVVPVEKQMDNVSKLLWNIAVYPLSSDEERTYQRGQYAGENKLEVSAKQLIPGYRQLFKFKYMSYQINYYNMHNPWINVSN